MVKKQSKPEAKRTARKPSLVDELSTGTHDEASWIAWEAPQFTYYEKGWLWSALVGLVALIFVYFFWLERNWSAIAVTVLGAIVFVQQARVKPKLIRFSLDDEGFHEGAKLYTWNELKSFWVSDRPGPYDHLYLETTHRWLPVRTIHLANVDPQELRARLSAHLPEHTTHGEQLTDQLIHWLRF